MPERPDFDGIIVDAGGDDLIMLKGDLATPAELRRRMEDLRLQRIERLKKATPVQAEMFRKWAREGEHVYAKRVIGSFSAAGLIDVLGAGSLTVYLSAPSLRDVLKVEADLGADREELEWFRSQSMAGMIQGTFSSRVEKGEPGSAHVCDLTEISREEFEAAQAAGWPDAS